MCFSAHSPNTIAQKTLLSLLHLISPSSILLYLVLLPPLYHASYTNCQHCILHHQHPEVTPLPSTFSRRHKMANFMLNEDAHDTTNYDGMTLLPGACTAAARPLFSLFAAHNNIIKDVHISENSSKKRAKIEQQKHS